MNNSAKSSLIFLLEQPDTQAAVAVCRWTVARILKTMKNHHGWRIPCKFRKEHRLGCALGKRVAIECVKLRMAEITLVIFDTSKSLPMGTHVSPSSCGVSKWSSHAQWNCGLMQPLQTFKIRSTDEACWGDCPKQTPRCAWWDHAESFWSFVSALPSEAEWWAIKWSLHGDRLATASKISFSHRVANQQKLLQLSFTRTLWSENWPHWNGPCVLFTFVSLTLFIACHWAFSGGRWGWIAWIAPGHALRSSVASLGFNRIGKCTIALCSRCMPSLGGDTTSRVWVSDYKISGNSPCDA